MNFPKQNIVYNNFIKAELLHEYTMFFRHFIAAFAPLKHLFCIIEQKNIVYRKSMNLWKGKLTGILFLPHEFRSANRRDQCQIGIIPIIHVILLKSNNKYLVKS